MGLYQTKNIVRGIRGNNLHIDKLGGVIVYTEFIICSNVK